MFIVRCKECNTELTGSAKVKSCGCPNQMIVKGESVTALDLSKVVLIKSEEKIKNQGFLTKDDLKYQEDRRKRKVRKLDFEVR